MHAQTAELATSSRALGEALRGLVESELACRGRPSRASRARSGHLAGAPAPELLVLPADRLVAELGRVRDAELLRAIFEWERTHDRRRSVLRVCQRRLRRLGVHVGGPTSEPWPGYDSLAEVEIAARAARLDAKVAARAYAYEWYRRRSRQVLAAMERRAGAGACRQAVEATLGGDPEELPFPGYETMQASPEGRANVRRVLAQASREQLLAGLAYEQRTKRRKVIEKAIRAEIRARASARSA